MRVCVCLCLCASCDRRRLWTPLNHAGWQTLTGRRPFLGSCSLLAFCGGYPPACPSHGSPERDPRRRRPGRHSRKCTCRPHRPGNKAPRIGPMPGRLLRIRASGRKTLSDLLIDALDALLEGEHLRGKLCNYARGYVLCGQANALGSGCAKFADPLMPRDLR
jgi:hypothetical protein